MTTLTKTRPTTRREALTMIGMVSLAAAGNASLSSFAWATEGFVPHARDTNFIPDRELSLALSDNLQRKAWLYAGQHYTEESGAVIVNENEQLRLILVNDTHRAHFLLLDGVRIDLAANEIKTIDLSIDQLQHKTLTYPAAGIAQTFRVRPSYQSHAIFAA